MKVLFSHFEGNEDAGDGDGFSFVEVYERDFVAPVPNGTQP